MTGVKAKFLATGLIVLGVVLASAIGQTSRDRGGGYSADPDIHVLQETVRLNKLRIEQLEARAARESPSYLDDSIADQQAPPPEPPAGAGRAPTRIMIIDAMEPVEADASSYEELELLKRDLEALQRTVDQKERSVSSMSGGSGYHRRYKNTSSSRSRSSHGQLLAEYETKLRKKKGEVKRLERELDEPKQILHGHWKSVIITLETTRDLSRTLDRMDRGDYLTWDGRRLRSDAKSQDWVVTRIEAVDPTIVDAEE